MNTSKAVGVFAYSDEKTQVEQIREFLNEKGASLPACNQDKLFENVLAIIKASEVLGQLTNEKDVENVLNSLFSLIITFEAGLAQKLVEAFAQVLSSDKFHGQGWQSNAGVAVRILSNLYHTFLQPEIQFTVFKHLLKCSGRARLTNYIDLASNPQKVEAACQQWGLSVSDKREVYRLLHVALIEDQRADAAAEAMTSLLRTYTDADADLAKEDALECVRTAIVDPKSFSFDHLLRLSAVKRLEQTDNVMYNVLKIFSEGRLNDYLKFIAANPSFVKEHLKVGDDVLVRKMQIITLISMAESNNVLPLSQISEELNIKDEEQLEEFLIDAIRINAINGKINDVKKELVITSFQYRTFDRPQWELLQKRLGTLLDNLKDAYSNLKDIHLVEGVES